MNFARLILVSVLFSSFLFAQVSNSKKNNIPAIVPVSWLKNNINNPKVVIVDLQPKDTYLKGHIKGAVNIPGQPDAQLLFDSKYLISLKFVLKKDSSFVFLQQEF